MDAYPTTSESQMRIDALACGAVLATLFSGAVSVIVLLM
jgi:hypothetical protein